MSDSDETVRNNAYQWFDDNFWAIVLGFVVGRIWYELSPAVRDALFHLWVEVLIFLLLLVLLFGVVLWRQLARNPTLN